LMVNPARTVSRPNAYPVLVLPPVLLPVARHRRGRPVLVRVHHVVDPVPAAAAAAHPPHRVRGAGPVTDGAEERADPVPAMAVRRRPQLTGDRAAVGPPVQRAGERHATASVDGVRELRT